MNPVLVACAHGTRFEGGRRAIAALVSAVAEALPEIDVVETWVDVQEPSLVDVMDTLAGQAAVVTPLLLSAGFHVRSDIADAIADEPGHWAAGTLGPDRLLAEILQDRLIDAGATPDDLIILGASSSSDQRAVADIKLVGALLERGWGSPVHVAHVGHSGKQVDQLVDELRPQGRRIVVASYLMAPGHFQNRLEASGADVVTRPLLGETPDPRMVRLVVERYRLAVAAHASV